MENINLENLATKSDLQEIRQDMITKDDLSRVFIKLDTKIDNVQSELKEEIDEKFDKIMDKSDEQIKLLEDIKTETTVHTLSYQQHQEKIKKNDNKLENHEGRIKILELKPTH